MVNCLLIYETDKVYLGIIPILKASRLNENITKLKNAVNVIDQMAFTVFMRTKQLEDRFQNLIGK